jgi:hypothetical protein
MFVHRIDPVIAEVRGVYLWWYGLSYALGFVELHVWFRLQRRRLAMTMREVYDISILVPLCVLIGGRLVEVFFYEWPYYRVHPDWIPALWIGGMSTHADRDPEPPAALRDCLREFPSLVRISADFRRRVSRVPNAPVRTGYGSEPQHRDDGDRTRAPHLVRHAAAVARSAPAFVPDSRIRMAAGLGVRRHRVVLSHDPERLDAGRAEALWKASPGPALLRAVPACRRNGYADHPSCRKLH